MKKLNQLFINLLFLLLIPIGVFADCGAAKYDNYKVKVKNSSGATTYERKYNEEKGKYEYQKNEIIIPYEATLYVIYDEAKIENDYLLEVTYDDSEYIVKASDLQNIDSHSSKSDEFKKSEYYTVVDTEVRSGPGVTYDVVGTIKADTNIMIIEEPLINGAGEATKDGAWLLISDGNTTGYIYYDGCSNRLPINIGTKASNQEYYYVGNGSNEYNLKFGQKIKVLYTVKYDKYKGYYIDLNGKRFELNESEVGILSDKKLMILDFNNVKIKDKNLKDISDTSTFNKNYGYDILYYSFTEFGVNYYVEKANKIYVIELKDSYYYDKESKYEYVAVIVDRKEKITFAEDMFYSFNKKEQRKLIRKGKTIEAYKLYNQETSDKVVYYNTILGFIYPLSSNPSIKIENLIEEELPIVDSDDVIETDNLNSKEYVTKCLAGTIGLSAITIIIIIIVNRKKRANKF